MGERSRFPNKEISILSQRHYFFLSGRSFTLVIGGGKLVKTFRSGDEEVFSRIGRVPLVDVDGVVGGFVDRGMLQFSNAVVREGRGGCLLSSDRKFSWRCDEVEGGVDGGGCLD